MLPRLTLPRVAAVAKAKQDPRKCQPPRLVFQGGFDGTPWIKHRGESDGPVNAGPPSGQWCDLLADRLLGRPESGSC